MTPYVLLEWSTKTMRASTLLELAGLEEELARFNFGPEVHVEAFVFFVRKHTSFDKVAWLVEQHMEESKREQDAAIEARVDEIEMVLDGLDRIAEPSRFV